MKQVSLSFVIVVSLLIGCVAGRAISPAASAQEPVQSDRSEVIWEYKCITNTTLLDRDIEDASNQLGASGWEMATVIAKGMPIYCYKRRM